MKAWGIYKHEVKQLILNEFGSNLKALGQGGKMQEVQRKTEK